MHDPSCDGKCVPSPFTPQGQLEAIIGCVVAIEKEMSTPDYQLVGPEHLNETVWATIKPSPINGVGVFAIRDIKEGQYLYLLGGSGEWLKTDLDKVVPEVRKLILQRWPIVRDGEPFLSPNDDAILMSFLNHSDTPNYDKNTDMALRDIKAGEEITEDYGVHKDILDL